MASMNRVSAYCRIVIPNQRTPGNTVLSSSKHPSLYHQCHAHVNGEGLSVFAPITPYMYTKSLYYRSTTKNACKSFIFHFSAWHLRLFKAETWLKHKTIGCQELSQKANRIEKEYISSCTSAYVDENKPVCVVRKTKKRQIFAAWRISTPNYTAIMNHN